MVMADQEDKSSDGEGGADDCGGEPEEARKSARERADVERNDGAEVVDLARRVKEVVNEIFPPSEAPRKARNGHEHQRNAGPETGADV